MWQLALFILFIGVIYYSYITNPAEINTAGTVRIQGIIIRASLDEIFNKIIPSQKIDLVAILSTNKTVIWSAEVQLNLASTYYDINNYILIIRTPQIVQLDAMQLYINEIEQRLQYLLKRQYIVISLTDEYGNAINNVVQHSLRTFYIFGLGILVIALGLYVYIKNAKIKYYQIKEVIIRK